MKRSLIVPISLLISLFALLLPSCQSQKKDKEASDSDLRLITYNVWYGFTKVPERKSTWLNWMKQQNPDVVALQELNEYSEKKLSEDAMYFGHAYSALLKEDGFPTGITSRFPIEDIQRTTEGFHHGLLRVRIEGIYFYVIHLHPSNWETRKLEIDLILQDVRKLPTGSRVVLAGDFNTFSPLDSQYYSHGRLEPFFQKRDRLYGEKNLKKSHLDYSVIQDLMDQGFKDLEAAFRSSTYIFSGSFPTRLEKEGEHGDLRRLDYVFASANLLDRVVRAKIISSDTTQILSDHLPLVLDLSSP